MDLAAAVAELKRSTDTFGPFIRAQAERIPERVALKFEDETVTYGAYDRAVNRIAARFRREGAAAGTPVAILAPNSPLFLVTLGAVAKLGAIGALINTHVTGAGLTHVLRASGAAIGVSDAAALPALDLVAGSHPVRFLTDAPPATALPRDVRPLEGWRDGPEAPEPDVPDVRGGDVFLYIYTSGTTGYPKPAVVRHLRFTMGGITLAGLLGVEADETIYAPLPLYHGESLFVGFAPAARAGLRPDIWTAFQARFGIARIIEMYGATEGNVALHNADGRVGSVGKPHPMLEETVRLARFDLARGELVRGPDGFCIPCAPSEPGELLGRVGGAMEYDGYTDRAASERKLVHDAFARGDAWFRTGDLLRQDADGYYYFVDRIGDTFRWKGENVATQEVADVLCGAPGVTEANVYGVEVPGEDGRAGMAALVLAGGARFDGAALHARAERHLPAYARPAFVRLVSEMDVTGTLKQRKLALAAEGYDPARVTDPLFVRDDAARAYVALTPAVLAELRDGRRRL